MVGKTVQGDIWKWLKETFLNLPSFKLDIVICLERHDSSLGQHLALRSPQLVSNGEGGGSEDKVEEDKEERYAGFPALDWELCFGRALSRWKLYFYFDCRSISDSSWAGRVIIG